MILLSIWRTIGGRLEAVFRRIFQISYHIRTCCYSSWDLSVCIKFLIHKTQRFGYLINRWKSNMFWCKQASRESTVNNVQHKWFATFGHCLFCIEWLLEEPFCVGEVFSMDWSRPLKLDIWFRTFKDARSGKFLFVDHIKQPSSKSSASSSAFWLNESPSSSSLSSPSSLSSSLARYLEIVFL